MQDLAGKVAFITGGGSGVALGQAKVFAEDLAVLEAQQANLTRYPQRRLLMLNIDAGGVQSRRILDRLIAQEQPQPLAA